MIIAEIPDAAFALLEGLAKEHQLHATWQPEERDGDRVVANVCLNATGLRDATCWTAEFAIGDAAAKRIYRGVSLRDATLSALEGAVDHAARSAAASLMSARRSRVPSRKEAEALRADTLEAAVVAARRVLAALDQAWPAKAPTP